MSVQTVGLTLINHLYRITNIANYNNDSIKQFKGIVDFYNIIMYSHEKNYSKLFNFDYNNMLYDI